MYRLLAVATLLAWLGLTAAPVSAAVPDDPANVQPLSVGAKAPSVTVRTAAGADFTLDPGNLARPTVLVFYRGGWCPYCNVHLGALAKAEQELADLGFDRYFLSADRPEILHSSLEDASTPFTLLSDANMSAARAFGIAFRVDDATFARYKSFGIDLEAASGQTHHELPVPAVFILDRAGVIRFAHANPDYTVRLAAEPLLEAARSVAAMPAAPVIEDAAQ